MLPFVVGCCCWLFVACCLLVFDVLFRCLFFVVAVFLFAFVVCGLLFVVCVFGVGGLTVVV